MAKLFSVICKSVLVFGLFLFSFISCSSGENLVSKKPSVVRMGITPYDGIGLCQLIEDSKKEKASFNYEFSCGGDSEILKKLINDELDLAIIDATSAVKFYNQPTTQKAYKAISLFSLNTFTLITNDTGINEISDLKDKNIVGYFENNSQKNCLEIYFHLISKNVEYTYEFKNTYEEFEQYCDNMNGYFYVILCEPNTTKFLLSHETADLKIFDLGEVLDEDIPNIKSVVVASNNFLSEYGNCINAIINDLSKSCNYVTDMKNIEKSADLVINLGFVENISNATEIIKKFCFKILKGPDFRNKYNKFVNMLFDFNHSTIGGTIPGNDFYYDNN